MIARIRGRRAAFTLVEALVGIVIGLGLIAIVLYLLNWAVRSLGRSDQRMDARENAVRTLGAIRIIMEDCWHYRIDPTGTWVMFQSPRERGKILYDKASQQISLQTHQGKDTPEKLEVLANGITDFSMHHLRRGIIQIAMKVARPEVHDEFKSLGDLEVVDEVLVPIMGLKDPMIPWHSSFEHPGGPEWKHGPGEGGRRRRRGQGDGGGQGGGGGAPGLGSFPGGGQGGGAPGPDGAGAPGGPDGPPDGAGGPDGPDGPDDGPDSPDGPDASGGFGAPDGPPGLGGPAPAGAPGGGAPGGTEGRRRGN